MKSGFIWAWGFLHLLSGESGQQQERMGRWLSLFLGGMMFVDGVSFGARR